MVTTGETDGEFRTVSQCWKWNVRGKVHCGTARSWTAMVKITVVLVLCHRVFRTEDWAPSRQAWLLSKILRRNVWRRCSVANGFMKINISDADLCWPVQSVRAVWRLELPVSGVWKFCLVLVQGRISVLKLVTNEWSFIYLISRTDRSVKPLFSNAVSGWLQDQILCVASSKAYYSIYLLITQQFLLYPKPLLTGSVAKQLAVVWDVNRYLYLQISGSEIRGHRVRQWRLNVNLARRGRCYFLVHRTAKLGTTAAH